MFVSNVCKCFEYTNGQVITGKLSCYARLICLCLDVIFCAVKLAGRRRIPRAHTCTLSLFLHIVATTFESRHLSFYTYVILQHGSYASSATLAEASLAVCKATFSIPTESQHTFQLSSIADLTWKANSKVPTHLPPIYRAPKDLVPDIPLAHLDQQTLV